MARSGMKPVYVGDVGIIVERRPKSGLAGTGIDIEQLFKNLTNRQICNLAVTLGFELKDILMQVNNCFEHDSLRMIAIEAREMPEGFNLFEHCTYCKNCWRIFRYADKEPYIAEDKE